MIYSAAQCSTENPGLLIINCHQLFFIWGTHKMIRQRSSFLHSQCCNHHIPFSDVMCSSLQSVGDRTFCIANAHYTFCHTKGSVFNNFARSSVGLGRKRHCLCIWQPSFSKSDIFFSAICWRSNFLYWPNKKFCLQHRCRFLCCHNWLCVSGTSETQ